MTNTGRIAIFLPLLVGGGAERVMVNLARGFVNRGIEIDLVLGRAEGPYLSHVPQKVCLIDLNATRTLTSLPGLIRYLKKNRPLAMISALTHANLVALWAKQLSRVSTKVIISLHSTIPDKTVRENLYFSKKQFFPILVKRYFPKADAIVAVSNGVATSYAQATGIPIDRIQVVYNPVIDDEIYNKAAQPLDHPWFTAGEPPVVLSVGRLSEEKDFFLLIRAFAIVRNRIPARLMILGEGEQRSMLQAQIKILNLENDISMPGFAMNPYPYMLNAALFVLSSKREGLPTALIESIAIGTSAVSTNCKSGPYEVLQGGKLGKLVNVGDENQMAEAIIQSLTNRDKRDNRNSMQKFSIENAVESYLKLIKNT